MYAIRVDDERKLLRVELSGRVTTDEALRAVSQAYTLAEAGGIRAMLCDLGALRRGPGSLLVVAAALAGGYSDGLRVALVGARDRSRMLERLVRFSGIGAGIGAFSTIEDAGAWLRPVLREVRPARRPLRDEAEALLGRKIVLEGGRGGRRSGRHLPQDPAA